MSASAMVLAVATISGTCGGPRNRPERRAFNTSADLSREFAGGGGGAAHARVIPSQGSLRAPPRGHRRP